MSEFIYDAIVIELQKEGTPLASAKIGTTDIKQLLKSHNITIGDILQDIVDSIIEKQNQTK
jgi:hypothetical protein